MAIPVAIGVRRQIVTVRLAAIIACSAGQIAVDWRVIGLRGAVLFVSSALFFAMLGLKWRQFWALSSGGRGDFAFYSCGGAVIGSLTGAILSLSVLGRVNAWLYLSVPFVVASIVYYAVGKAGCIQLYCCEAIRGVNRVRLPVTELAASLLIVAIAVALVAVRAAPAVVLASVAMLFATLRVFSRLKRGHRPSRCFKSADVIGVYGVAAMALTFVLRST